MNLDSAEPKAYVEHCAVCHALRCRKPTTKEPLPDGGGRDGQHYYYRQLSRTGSRNESQAMSTCPLALPYLTGVP